VRRNAVCRSGAELSGVRVGGWISAISGISLLL
jgi:hypothetical protein